MKIFFQKLYSNKIFWFIFITAFLSITGFAQQKKYSVANAHSHNDYLQAVPFYTAYNAGFGSIEADVFPVNGILLVSHSRKALQSNRTLESLYLNPLLKELKKNSRRKVNLLIDIKENYKESLQLLLKELIPLKRYLSSQNDRSKPVTILISGERPPPAAYKNYPDYIFFDDDLRLEHSPEERERVGLVSLSFERYSHWNGERSLPEKDRDTLQNVIDRVHHAGKKIRFWAAPDNENSWQAQMKLGVDFIGTDKIQKLSEFINGK